MCRPAFTWNLNVAVPPCTAAPRATSLSQSNSLTRSPSSRNSSFSPVISPKARVVTHLPFVDGEDLEDVVAVGRELVLAPSGRRACRTAYLRCDSPARCRPARGNVDSVGSVTSPIAMRLIFAAADV